MRKAGMKVGSLVEICFSEEDLHYDDVAGGHFVHHYSHEGELKSTNMVYAGYVVEIEGRGDEVFGLVNPFDVSKMRSGRLDGIQVSGSGVQKYRIIPKAD